MREVAGYVGRAGTRELGTRLGRALAIVGGFLWVLASIADPDGEAWSLVAAITIVAAVVIAGGLGPSAGFWGWLAVRGFLFGIVALAVGQLLGAGVGSTLSGVGLAATWLTRIFAAIGALASGRAGRVGPAVAIVGWFLVYAAFVLPLGTWVMVPYGLGWAVLATRLIGTLRITAR